MATMRRLTSIVSRSLHSRARRWQAAKGEEISTSPPSAAATSAGRAGGGANAGVAQFLGFAGVLPFVFGAFGASRYSDYRQSFVTFERNYAVSILSFLGAVQWGLALRSPVAGLSTYLWSVTPALLAWLTAQQPSSSVALPMLTMAFPGVYAVDALTLGALNAPPWYARLRLPLTIAATASLGVTWMAHEGRKDLPEKPDGAQELRKLADELDLVRIRRNVPPSAALER